MRKLLLVSMLACTVSLAGCITDTVTTALNVTASPQSALVAANTFDALETVATAYMQLPLCGNVGATVACGTASARAAIVPAVRSGRTARNQVEDLLKANNGGAIKIATMNTLNAAIATLQSVYAQYNIQH